MEPTNDEANAKLSSSLSTAIFKKKGKEILEHIKDDPDPDESNAEAGLRLGLSVLFSELLNDSDQNKT